MSRRNRISVISTEESRVVKGVACILFATFVLAMMLLGGAVQVSEDNYYDAEVVDAGDVSASVSKSSDGRWYKSWSQDMVMRVKRKNADSKHKYFDAILFAEIDRKYGDSEDECSGLQLSKSAYKNGDIIKCVAERDKEGRLASLEVAEESKGSGGLLWSGSFIVGFFFIYGVLMIALVIRRHNIIYRNITDEDREKLKQLKPKIKELEHEYATRRISLNQYMARGSDLHKQVETIESKYLNRDGV